MRALLPLVLVLVLGLGACAGPPDSDYVGGNRRSTAGAVGLGKDAAGEACTYQAGGGGADVFCGTWGQPSGHVVQGDDADLNHAATASAWRSALDNRFDCDAPRASTVLGDTAALVLTCRRKVGGWPQAAFVARLDGHTYFADGILPAFPVLERAVGVLSGRLSAQAAPGLAAGQADALLASRLASQSFGAGDVGKYQDLMIAGTRANLAESYVPAERAFRAALALQQKTLGARDPNTAVPLMLVALQLSDQGRTAEADEAFARAVQLMPGATDPTALPRLAHYRALNAVNENKPGEALPLLQQAEAGYARLLPPDMLVLRPPAVPPPLANARRSGPAAPAQADATLLEPDQQAALIGVVETRRYQAIVLRELGRTDEARGLVRSAEALADARGLRQRDLTARLFRTASVVDDRAAEGAGYGRMQQAVADFGVSQPGTRPLAQTELLRGGQEMRGGSSGAALGPCRRAVVLLRELKSGTSAPLMMPCLSAFAAEARAHPGESQALLGEMFAASQLAQGGVTVQQIAQASARMIENAKNPKVGEAIRRQQDAALALAALQRQVDALGEGRPARDGPSAEELRKQLTAAQATLADSDAALQAAAPNYGQLVQEVAGADDVLRALAPGEALVSMAMTETEGWLFVLRDNAVSVSPTRGGTTEMAALVKRVRASMEFSTATPPPFDTEAAQAIWTGTLGQAGARLEGIDALTVVPTGPLLSIPFNLLLTGPATQGDLAGAPWLVRRAAVSHVPAAANFVSLRKAASAARGSRPWYGFGDFRPVTLAQAEKTFPSSACVDSAKLFAGLPPLPFARRELAAARMLLGGSEGDALEGPSFTTPRVLQQDLRAYRVLHFATHALLPTDLRCQTEPAIVTSGTAGAANARTALLTSSDVATMQLDADVVILSACNSGGPNGSTSGESLSGLARSFFFAGARALMVTHWSVNDQAAALLVAGTMQRLKAGDRLGVAGALRGAELALLDGAGKSFPAAIAHPFYWAPFALVGEGRGRTVSANGGVRRTLAGL